jgi:uncharacterized membrane protein YtjA (UPF0391 family)
MTSILMSSVLAVPVLAQTALAWWAIVFFIIAVIAYLLGAQGVAGMTASIGRTLLFVFLALAILFAIIGLVR